MGETLDILARLVAFDTVSAQPNVAIIDYIGGFLRDCGARTTRLESGQMGKCGLYAELGPAGPGGILLSAHTDVVPVDGQDWQRAPFELSREGDRLFGRGTTDMKGYVACMLQAVKRAQTAPLRAPLKLVFSYDEETGCLGIQEMLPALTNLIGRPRCCFVGEPTQMQIAVGHKGKAALRAVCTGQAGHSALAPQFVNAVHMAADLVAALRDLQEDLARTGAQDVEYDIPYSTVHVGKLAGGTALNIVPDHAELTFEYRHLAADTPALMMSHIKDAADSVTASYQPAFQAAAIHITEISAYPGLDVPLDAAVVAFAQRLAGGARTTKVAFGTEAGFFDQIGIPTIVCGPGSMAGQGHKPDEYIELGQLAACDAMLAGVVAELST